MRITQRDGCGNWWIKGLPWEDIYPGKTINKEIHQRIYGALYKLKNYEDSEEDPEKVQNIPKWISVKEKFPGPDYQTVLCVTENNYCAVAIYEKGYGFRSMDSGIDGEIVAWMPLPEPYM